MLKKHTPLFYSLDDVKSPFLLTCKPFVPNKFKYVKDPVQDFNHIDSGMYFLLPGKNECTVKQLGLLEKNVFEHIENQIKPSFSLKRCKSFAHKFSNMRQNVYLNTFSYREDRLYCNPLKCVLDRSVCSLQDTQQILAHLVNFYVVCNKVDYKSVFFDKALSRNVEILNSYSNTSGFIYSRHKTTKTPILNIRLSSYCRSFYGNDLDQMLEFLMPLLYNFFTDDVNLSKFLQYK